MLSVIKNKMLPVLLIIALTITMMPCTAFAGVEYVAEPEAGFVNQEKHEISIDIEPNYSKINLAQNKANYLTNVEDAAVIVREKMVQRVSDISVDYYFPTNASQSTMENTIQVIIRTAMEHTGNPKEGDSIYYAWGRWNGSISGFADSTGKYVTITYNVKYYSNASQEAALDKAIADLKKKLNLDGKTDYEKIKAIYDYMCENITYDHEHKDDDNYVLKATAYAALVNKTAVCQGYAVLFYRLALEYGIDARIVDGTSRGESHAWNIVKLDGKYYYMDSTWDAGDSMYSYFLKGSQGWKDHDASDEYLTAAFKSQYPMSTTDYMTVTNSLDYYGIYDGKPHSINLNIPAGATATYRVNTTDEFKSTKPTFTNVGTYTVYYRIMKDGSFLMAGSGTVTIVARPIDVMTASLEYNAVTYDGTAKKPAVTIKGLKQGTDFTVSYQNNVNVGTATVTITGKGNYTGTLTATFRIMSTGTNDLFDDGNVIRLAGSNRYGTSAEISEGFIANGKAKAIVIVNGLGFADALAATPFATSIGAPILMADGPAGTLDDTVVAEINRIDPDHNAKVYLIGGEGAVAPKVVTTLRSLGYSSSNIARVAGDNRFETAIEVAKKMPQAKTAYIAYGLNYPDALGGGSAAALNNGVILFTADKKLSSETKAYLNKGNFENVVILGGTGAVSAAVEKELKGMFASGKVTRVAGGDRFLTSVEVAKKYFPNTDTVVIATGMNFADALAGGPLSAELNAPILLVYGTGKTIPQDMIDYIRASGAENVVILGGTGAVSDAIKNQVKGILR